MIKPKKSIVLSIETILFTRTFAFDGHVVVLFGVGGEVGRLVLHVVKVLLTLLLLLLLVVVLLLCRSLLLVHHLLPSQFLERLLVQWNLLLTACLSPFSCSSSVSCRFSSVSCMRKNNPLVSCSNWIPHQC